MGRAKDIVVKVIPSRIAMPFVQKYHYSGKVVQNSSLHFGCFLDGKLHGVMSFGASMDKRRVINLVTTDNKTEATKWNEFLELNRMAFDDYLPRNSESRCLGIAFRLIRKNAPHIKWVISFSDATASGDGTIYRASGFVLTQINKNKSILVMPDGERIAQLNFTNGYTERKKFCQKYGVPMWTGATIKPLFDHGVKYAEGYQLRYIKMLTPDCRLNCDQLDFDAIDEIGAGMLRGEKVTRESRHKKSGAEDSTAESDKVESNASC